VGLQPQVDNERLGWAAVRIVVSVESGLTPQSRRINSHAMHDPRCVARWQLVQPGLSNWKPPAISVLVQRLLAAAAGAIQASHHTQQHRAVTSRANLRGHRSPISVRPGLEASVPDGPDVRRLRYVEKDNLVLHDGIAR